MHVAGHQNKIEFMQINWTIEPNRSIQTNSSCCQCILDRCSSNVLLSACICFYLFLLSSLYMCDQSKIGEACRNICFIKWVSFRFIHTGNTSIVTECLNKKITCWQEKNTRSFHVLIMTRIKVTKIPTEVDHTHIFSC